MDESAHRQALVPARKNSIFADSLCAEKSGSPVRRLSRAQAGRNQSPFAFSRAFLPSMDKPRSTDDLPARARKNQHRKHNHISLYFLWLLNLVFQLYSKMIHFLLQPVEELYKEENKEAATKPTTSSTQKLEEDVGRDRVNRRSFNQRSMAAAAAAKKKKDEKEEKERAVLNVANRKISTVPIEDHSSMMFLM